MMEYELKLLDAVSTFKLLDGVDITDNERKLVTQMSMLKSNKKKKLCIAKDIIFNKIFNIQNIMANLNKSTK